MVKEQLLQLDYVRAFALGVLVVGLVAEAVKSSWELRQERKKQRHGRK